MNLKQLLQDTDFRFNKALGQNFVTDTNLLDAIVSDSGVLADDTVVEIGTGAGTLTARLAAKAKKVYTFEVDRNLQKVLDITLRGIENVEVIFKDVLKMSDEELTEIIGGGSFKVVANLPYYITTPLVMRFWESPLNVESMTVMVQKEVADRFKAKPNTPDYSAVTLAVDMRGRAEVTRAVNRTMFFPAPNVDSAVVRFTKEEGKLAGEDFKLIQKLVRSAFTMRRKTLGNNLSATFGISKAEAEARITAIGLPAMVRGEVLSLGDFVKLSHQFK